MSQATQRGPWSWDGYLDWEAGQPVRYELVDGEVRAMDGGTAEHDTVGNTLRAELRARLRGTPCRVQGPDLKVKAGQDGRYPDALIDCRARVPGALAAQDPVAVFEVLSRSTASIDQSLKLRDCDATPGIWHHVLISQDEPRILVYQRDEQDRLGGPGRPARGGHGRHRRAAGVRDLHPVPGSLRRAGFRFDVLAGRLRLRVTNLPGATSAGWLNSCRSANPAMVSQLAPIIDSRKLRGL